jgi:hypothetical protein
VREVDYARDHLHVGFVCAKGKAHSDDLPSVMEVHDFFRELRAVQNRVPPPSGS